MIAFRGFISSSHHRRALLWIGDVALVGVLVTMLAGRAPGVIGLPEAASGRLAERAGGYSLAPMFQAELNQVAVAQQFEMRARFVLPNRPNGYSAGIRPLFSASPRSGWFFRLSVRLPGPRNENRPYLELSGVVPAGLK